MAVPPSPLVYWNHQGSGRTRARSLRKKELQAKSSTARSYNHRFRLISKRYTYNYLLWRRWRCEVNSRLGGEGRGIPVLGGSILWGEESGRRPQKCFVIPSRAVSFRERKLTAESREACVPRVREGHLRPVSPRPAGPAPRLKALLASPKKPCPAASILFFRDIWPGNTDSQHWKSSQQRLVHGRLL